MDDAEARPVVERLFGEQERFARAAVPPLFRDLGADAEDFRRDLGLLDQLDLDAPVVDLRDGRVASVALSQIVASAFEGGLYREAGSDAVRWARPAVPSLDAVQAGYFDGLDRAHARIPGLRTLNRRDARQLVIESAVAFAGDRIRGVRDLLHRQGDDRGVKLRADGSDDELPGCEFTVNTRSDGLRVFWSGAYRISANYFGRPTSPARSALLTGSYVFGVDDGPYGPEIQWDTSAVVSLPGEPEVYLSY